MVTAFITAAEMQEQLGGIPLVRIRVVPPPSLATEENLLNVLDHENRICELIDGTLVEKTMGYLESSIACALIMFLGKYLDQNDLGIVLGPDGTHRILEDQIRVPDVALLSWRHFPGRVLPHEPVPAIAPDLAVEVLSAGNTRGEMDRKLKDCFAAGVKSVWFIDPASESAIVYEGLRKCRKLQSADSLKGGKVLPGFELPLEELFKKAGQRSRGQQ